MGACLSWTVELQINCKQSGDWAYYVTNCKSEKLDQREKLLDRAKYQSVFDERIGPDYEADRILIDMLNISDDEDGDEGTADDEAEELARLAALRDSAHPAQLRALELATSRKQKLQRLQSQKQQLQQEQLKEKQQLEKQQREAEANELASRFTGSGPSRAMWSSMQEVKDSGLLADISKDQLKLQEAQFEIITTEASYYQNLVVVIEHFYKQDQLDHTRQDSELRALDKHHLFSNIVEIFDCSVTFLKAMEDEWRHSPIVDFISRVILDHIQRFRVYKDYCRNFYYQTKTLQKLCQEERFQYLLRQLERNPQCRCITLQSYLEMPMKRIMSLQLLMDAVMRRMKEDHPAYQDGLKALGMLMSLAKECDQESRMMSQKEEMLQLQNMLTFDKVKKVGCWGSGRQLVKAGQLKAIRAVPNTQGFVPRMSLKKSYLQLHALSDLLIVSRPKGDNGFQVLKHCSRRLVDAELVSPGSSQQQQQQQQQVKLLQLRLVDRSDGTDEVTLQLEPKSREEGERWLAVFCPCDELGDPIYDPDDCPQVKVVSDYHAQQKDDLELRAGEIVNVYKKTDEGNEAAAAAGTSAARSQTPTSEAGSAQIT